jgi:hypothetical protein
MVTAIEIMTVLGSSLLAFLLGVCIGLSLGYSLWVSKDE